MTDRKPVLQVYGPIHALSSRGLHVRQSSRAWKLIRPMEPALLAIIHSVCERLCADDAARLLCMLDPRMVSDDAPAARASHPCLQELLQRMAADEPAVAQEAAPVSASDVCVALR